MNDEVLSIRAALAQLPEVAAQTATTTPDLRSIFTARSHEGAIDPRREIVVGDRGVGKSFWSSVLKDDAARTAVAPMYPRHQLDKVSVSLGFAEDIGRKEYPSSRTLRDLLAGGVRPENVWRAVILGCVCHWQIQGWDKMTWAQRCAWISENAETEEALLDKRNHELVAQGRRQLIIFDALDRLGQDWSTIRSLSRALLSTILEMRSFSNISTKLFLRPDMDGDREIWTIRDGSKLRQNQVSLTWSSSDLYGFVWHWLLHQPEARQEFIKLVFRTARKRITPVTTEQLIKVPDFLLEEADLQRDIFQAIAGKMMGAGSRKGHPFTWIPKHLADARGRVSLRSFIIALREAARETPSSAGTPLTYDPIKRGVQEASLNRVEQLKEDYLWIDDVLKPLAGLRTPNDEKNFIAKWKEEDTLASIFQN